MNIEIQRRAIMPKPAIHKDIRKTLFQVIDDHVARKHEFLQQPGRDFTRHRKLSLDHMVKATMLLGSGSIDKEMLEYFDYQGDTVTGSAFSQQRDKLSAKIFKSILHQFTHSFTHYKTFMGYRVVAVDGSDLSIPHNPNDEETYIQSVPGTKGFNLLHVNAFYDILNRVYLDAEIQPRRGMHEHQALIEMAEKSNLDSPVLLIADRGYESYNTFAHIMAKGWKFLIRVKDINSRSMLGTFNPPASGEFDLIIHRELTRKQSKFIKQQPDRYKFLPSTTTFDFLDENTPYYPISFRAVKVQLEDGSYQCFITNLEEDRFPPEEIKSLYHLRWGIETSFRELKHTLALTHLHSKKKESIAQEIFAKMTMYNFCSIITSHVVIQKKDRKHDYQVNFSRAISICKHYFKENTAFLDICKLIQKYILPIRRERAFPRQVKFRTFVSFN